MTKVNCNGMAFNDKFQEIVYQLESRVAYVQHMMVSLFKRDEAASDNEFFSYICFKK